MSGDDTMPADLRELLDREDPEAREELRRIWTALDRAEETRTYDVDGAWAELTGRLDQAPDTGRTPGASRFAGLRAPLAAAAVAALAVLTGLGWWTFTPASRSAGPGEQVTVTLPDGSTVRLNADSRIRYDRGFWELPGIEAGSRRVRLEGEAYFTVREGDRPFRVETENAVVEVLGTEFAVRSRGKRRPVTEVVLASGRVRLEPRTQVGGGDAVSLTRSGETSRVRGGEWPTPPRIIDLGRATAWVRGGFAMTAAPVSEVLAELERRFDTRLRLRARGAADDTLTLHYGGPIRLEDVLNDLATIQGLKFRRTARGYELYRE